MNILFDVDYIINNNSFSQTAGTFIYRLQKGFVDCIVKKARELNANRIVTNGNLAFVIQDYAGFEYKPLKIDMSMELYPIGILNGISIFVDPNMMWNDNYIHFEIFDKLLIRKLKIKTLENTLTEEEKKFKSRMYSGYVIDTKQVLI